MWLSEGGREGEKDRERERRGREFSMSYPLVPWIISFTMTVRQQII
jgi:hypothetical protein